MVLALSNSLPPTDGAVPDVRQLGVQPGDAASAAAGAPTAPIADHADLSPLASLLGTMVSKAGALSSFRPETVARLKAAVADGSYQPDLNQLASRVAQALNAGAV
ncbi:MAG TPA: flagellar biosynthesis anti-sigma factor FlgM [Candidatus Binataceae bacterium]|jgi:flagellar biosynthesis anti-sigma factor FlgM|nr:flagellar biosynthesis anti-sigma factor FlgM [Candidatus Binataceae bacterium]